MYVCTRGIVSPMTMPEQHNITQDEFLIPVKETISAFRNHLISHPRTILSARYGDGKSFFLKKFEEDVDARGEFVFLTLYPVNYQVVENRDIFDLIKYDLIFQLYTKGLIQNSSKKISTSILLYHYIISHQWELAQFFCEAGAMVGILPEQLGKLIGSGSKVLADWEKYKKEFGNGDAAVERFYDKIDRHYLYEADAITAFIKETIAEYRTQNPNKKIVLVIEDLDRLDPAHLFRILNVLSAQVDYAYRYGLSTERITVAGNKFDVDNVLLVMDYDNTKSIYHHFYGPEASFEGYINKFISHGVFRYSLTQERYKHFADYVARSMNLNLSLVHEMLPEGIFKDKTIREVDAAMRDTAVQVLYQPQYLNLDNIIHLPIEMLQLMVIMRRLGLDDESIARRVEQAITNCPNEIMMYIGGFWLSYKRRTAIDSFYIPAREKSNIYQINIIEVRKDGYARVEVKEFLQISQQKRENLREFAKYMLNMVAV